MRELSLILAEFAEDMHNDIGIWRTFRTTTGSGSESAADAEGCEARMAP